jgi:Meiotically up-regulated gene 113
MFSQSPIEKYAGYIAGIMQHFPDEQSRHAGQDGFVYIAATDDRTICKIGWSLNPQRRVRSLPYLRLLHYFPGDRGVETALHQRFAAYALPHERFQVKGEMLEFLIELHQTHGIEWPVKVAS